MRSSLKSGSTNSRKSLGFTTSVTNVLIASPQTICWRPSLTSRSPSPTISSASRSERRSEEHTSELQSRLHLVCRLLLEKKKKRYEQNVNDPAIVGRKKNETSK